MAGVGERFRRGEPLDVSDVTCPICLCILLEPVEMPCQHTICHKCFQESVEHSNINCPVCRIRLSVWCRRATKNHSLINQPLWNYIQEKFQSLVKSHQEGSDLIDPDETHPCLPNHLFAKEGEIKSEFEAVIEREAEERARREREEEEQSKELIKKLEQEYSALKNQTLQDEEFARRLLNNPSPGKENLFTPGKSKKDNDSTLGQNKLASETKDSPIEARHVGKINGKDVSKSPLFSTANITSFRKENNYICERGTKTEELVNTPELGDKEEDAPSIAGCSIGPSHILSNVSEQSTSLHSEQSENQTGEIKKMETEIFPNNINDFSLVEEQRRLEQLLDQEKKDLELAKEMQRKLNEENRLIDRKKGSPGQYTLRATSSSQKRKKRDESKTDKSRRQLSIEDCFKKKKLFD